MTTDSNNLQELTALHNELTAIAEVDTWSSSGTVGPGPRAVYDPEQFLMKIAAYGSYEHVGWNVFAIDPLPRIDGESALYASSMKFGEEYFSVSHLETVSLSLSVDIERQWPFFR